MNKHWTKWIVIGSMAMIVCGCPPQEEELSFSVIDDFDLPEGAGLTYDVVLFESAPEFQGYFGVAPPPSIAFPDEWAVFYSAGARPIPGYIAGVDRLVKAGSTMTAHTTLREPGNACEVLGFTRPAWRLVAFDNPGAAVSSLTEVSSTTSFDCAANGVGYWEGCTELALCGADLVCAGLTRSQHGFCAEVWMWDTFFDETPAAIPDNDPVGLTKAMVVSGLATVDMDVIVYVELDHDAPDELRITLTNPDTNEVVVWDRESESGGNFVIHRAPVGFSGDESVNGIWTLKVMDLAGWNTGTVERWSLEIVSRWD